VKNLTSITSLVVQIADDGDASGMTSDIIATVSPKSRQSNSAGAGFFRSDGDDMMKVAFEEAVRAVTIRYPIWEPGHIDISFGEKFTGHGGPSAGTAFAVLMLSTLEGFDIDPKCAVTGDITVDWKVRKVGGVTAKLRGATLDKCAYAAIPEENATSFADMGVLYGTPSLWNIQVFSISTLQDAVSIARKDRSPQLAEAISQFADLQTRLAKSERPTLKLPETVKILQHILEIAPNHLSAKALLAIANNTASKTLSANATIYQLGVIMYPIREALNGKGALTRESLPTYVAVNARKRLGVLRPIANKELQPLRNEIAAFIEAVDGFVARTVSPDGTNDEHLWVTPQPNGGRTLRLRIPLGLISRCPKDLELLLELGTPLHKISHPGRIHPMPQRFDGFHADPSSSNSSRMFQRGTSSAKSQKRDRHPSMPLQ
jgi:hypothetical protein